MPFSRTTCVWFIRVYPYSRLSIRQQRQQQHHSWLAAGLCLNIIWSASCPIPACVARVPIHAPPPICASQSPLLVPPTITQGVGADWGGTEGIGTELRKIKKEIAQLANPRDPEQVRVATRACISTGMSSMHLPPPLHFPFAPPHTHAHSPLIPNIWHRTPCHHHTPTIDTTHTCTHIHVCKHIHKHAQVCVQTRTHTCSHTHAG